MLEFLIYSLFIYVFISILLAYILIQSEEAYGMTGSLFVTIIILWPLLLPIKVIALCIKGFKEFIEGL